VADRLGRAQSGVALVGRHLDVGHHDVWPVGPRLAHEVDCVARRGHHLEACLAQDLADALADDGVVVADDDSQGRRAHEIGRT
jgi:hypothetical protein